MAEFQFQHLMQNEVRALRSIFNYYREVDEDAADSVIYLAIIHDLGRNHHERSCMISAIEDWQASVSETSKPTSFLSIIDHGRALFKAEAEDCGNDMTYHFLRLIHSYHRKCSKEGRYILAQEFMEHELRLRKDEEDRQVEQVKSKQCNDRQQLAMAHTRQAEEFQQSWDAFLKDFEGKSQELINELSETHRQQLLSLKQSNEESASTTQAKWSKELIGHRKRQSLMSDQQRYEEAHQTKLISDALEEKERSDHNSITNYAILKREANLTQKHQTEMSVLLKRIESKRRELQKQRDDEIARLIQRNKNILASFDSKNMAECLKLAANIEQHVKKLLANDV